MCEKFPTFSGTKFNTHMQKVMHVCQIWQLGGASVADAQKSSTVF